MNTRSIYHWDFNRLSADFDSRFETCSIAIFQWQPKASGKGLKKVNASRVCGYTDHVAKVYEKAQEICDRLNVEQATVTRRPAWLQKQYSVPRPKSAAPRLPVGRLTPATVRSLRERVMKQQLLPHGFVRGKDATWIRARGKQIQLIYFQGSKYGDEYFVNLGVHFTPLTPLFVKQKILLNQYSFLDCGLQMRLPGEFLYGSDRDSLEKLLKANVASCLKAFAQAERAFPWPANRILSVKADRSMAGGWFISREAFVRELRLATSD
jgi:hypothetical protein